MVRNGKRAIRVGVKRIEKILDLAGEDENNWFLSGFISVDDSWVVIGIPVYYNRFTTYLVFTNNKIVVARRSMWKGLKAEEIYSLPYDLIKTAEIKISRLRGNKLTLNLNSGVSETYKINNRKLAIAISETLNDYTTLVIEE